MAVKCVTQQIPKITFEMLQQYAVSDKQRLKRNVEFSISRIDSWYTNPGQNAIKALNGLKGASRQLMELDLEKTGFSPAMLLWASARGFVIEYSSNLTRLDGSRRGPVGLWSNAFAIVDCLSAGRFNNAQTLRDQAVQLLNQRAYEDQDAYAKDLELQKDPESYVEIIPHRLFVFAHELMGLRAGQVEQPWKDWDIVGDQDYIAAARKVYTTDMDEAAQVLCQLCNLHVQYSNPFPADDERDHLIGFEFDTPVRAIWPTEIFAWLRLRQERGLELPEVEHPLLDQPLGRFDPAIPTQWEHEDWFVELVQKLVDFHPRYANLPRMVFEQP